METETLEGHLPESAAQIEQLADKDFDELMIGLAREQLLINESALTIPQQWLNAYLNTMKVGTENQFMSQDERYIVYSTVEDYFRQAMGGGNREEFVYEWMRDNPVKAAIFDRSQRFSLFFHGEQRRHDQLSAPTLPANHPLNSSAWFIRTSYRLFIDDGL